ncbi:disintegrin and metalloproteinase domain-containing protein 33 isoform X11 [Dasypus novemcinctus]|uniref:disintegrin and metalloproteinase domain-containing protein 33 isoform X11 n=1 Tax=Dasypus novemcinctus TaxID=9361 RepID=UPI00265FDB8D|nr:disintegrin and metalloproteinase domain-containing protein 33 isoform X13 [Dasypus novemcinctus]
MGRGSRGARGWPALLLLLLLPARGARAPPGPPRPPGEPVTPRWVLDGRPRPVATPEEPAWKPDVGLVALEAEGQDLLLELEKNHRLLAPGYTETLYSPDGQSVELVPKAADHCHYHGRVRGFPGSWIALSTCAGLRGLIVLGDDASYYLHPPAPRATASTHRLFRMEQLLGRKRACGQREPGGPGGTAGCPRVPPSRERREAPGSPRYLELYLVADHALFLTQHRNFSHTKQRLLDVANYVDQLLRTLGIQVALSGLEVWTARDHSRVSADANATLRAFLQWRRGLWARRPHDSAQLLTGRVFQGATVGLAPVEGMCSAESSGGVSSDHADLAVGAAATMAHEIGHSLGLSHDPDGCCVEVPTEQGGCVMAAATGHPFPRVFSACSRRQLRAFFRKGGGACLSNAPEPGLAVRRPRCGNGFVEAGEECDCGDSQECLDPCCLAHNCSLRAGAQCARGDCCALCLLRPAGVLCRLAAGDCDLPEFCTGASALCPPDVYVLDGSPCAGGRGYCRDGACPTLEQQCQQLWGPGSHPAPETCFQIVNSAGDAHEDGGGDSEGHAAPRVQRDARCGKLQCQGGERSPRAPHAARVDSTVHLGGRKITCTGAVALPGAPLDLPGLGLVETGTQCGPGMVCQDGRCQNATSPELERCLSACHGHGVCNSNHHCHCRPGWAPPSCEQPGPGGSVDSGPVQPAERDAFLPAVLLSFLLPLLPGAGLAWCYYRHPPACLRRPVRLAEAPCELRQVPNPNPAPGERRLLR